MYYHLLHITRFNTNSIFLHMSHHLLLSSSKTHLGFRKWL